MRNIKLQLERYLAAKSTEEKIIIEEDILKTVNNLERELDDKTRMLELAVSVLEKAKTYLPAAICHLNEYVNYDSEIEVERFLIYVTRLIDSIKKGG